MTHASVKQIVREYHRTAPESNAGFVVCLAVIVVGLGAMQLAISLHLPPVIGLPLIIVSVGVAVLIVLRAIFGYWPWEGKS